MAVKRGNLKGKILAYRVCRRLATGIEKTAYTLKKRGYTMAKHTTHKTGARGKAVTLDRKARRAEKRTETVLDVTKLMRELSATTGLKNERNR